MGGHTLEGKAERAGQGAWRAAVMVSGRGLEGRCSCYGLKGLEGSFNSGFRFGATQQVHLRIPTGEKRKGAGWQGHRRNSLRKYEGGQSIESLGS